VKRGICRDCYFSGRPGEPIGGVMKTCGVPIEGSGCAGVKGWPIPTRASNGPGPSQTHHTSGTDHAQSGLGRPGPGRRGLLKKPGLQILL